MCGVASHCLQVGDRLTPGGRHAPGYPSDRPIHSECYVTFDDILCANSFGLKWHSIRGQLAFP